MKKYISFALLICISHMLKAQVQNGKYDSPAVFPEGKFTKYVIDHVKFDKNSPDIVDGQIIVTVNIDSLGNVDTYGFPQRLTPEMNKAFQKVVNASPKWQAATLNGKRVSVFLNFKFDVSTNLDQVTTIKPIDLPTAKPADNEFPKPDVLPIFRGGIAGFSKFVTDNMHYPKADKERNLQGKLIVSFVVEKDGSLNEFKIVQSPSYDMSVESLRVLALSPKWTPGTKDGQPVKVLFSVPVNFGLSSR
jgi:hypothetical protein